MNSNNFSNQIHQQMNDAFLLQDPEFLDVVFEIEEKKLYADKFRLISISPTFKAMLSDRWHSSKDEPIKITEYKFDDFKEFLFSLYSGECQLTNKNIFTMIDIAEFYQIPYLKKMCDGYLSDEMDYYYDNMFMFFELSNKYSLPELKGALQAFITENFTTLIRTDEFLNASKSNIYEFINIEPKPEEIFEAIFEWSAHQVAKTKKQENIFVTNDTIKTEISEFLPYFQVHKMRKSFVAKYVVDRTFIFSDNEIIEYLNNLNVIVKITNSDGFSISGSLSYKTNETDIKIIQSLQNRLSENVPGWFTCWSTKCKIPSTPSPLKKREGVKWYLIYFHDGDVGVKYFTDINEQRNYLIAEMDYENGFAFNNTCNCKIEVL